LRYSVLDFTYGVELEYADVDCFNELPKGAKWSREDYTIVNSNGIANDPKGELYEFGGEVNTKPTATMGEQIIHIKEINSMLRPRPVINYKCNLHVHIGVPGLIDDVDSCKRILKYVHDYVGQSFEICDPIVIPTAELYPDAEELAWAKKRYRKNKLSHRCMLPEARYEEAMKAETFGEFYDAHAPIGKSGKRVFHLAPRAAVNMKSLKKHGTIEFRHFFGTLDMVKMRNCLIWCAKFLNAALNNMGEPTEILERLPWLTFPHPEPFNVELAKGFDKTTISKNLREEAKRNIAVMLNKKS